MTGFDRRHPLVTLDPKDAIMPVATSTPRAVLTDFNELVRTAPDTTLFTFVGADGRDEGSLNASELATAAEDIAYALRDRGIVPGDRLVLVYPPSLDFIKALTGCLIAGVIPVPVYPPHPLRSGTGLAKFSAIVANSGARAALTNRAYDRARVLGRISGLAPGNAAAWPRIPWYRTDQRLPRRPGPLAWHEAAGPDEPALLQYTSGTTGDPKGAILTQGNLAYEVRANKQDLGLGPRARGVFWVPQYHDLGLISVILSTLAGNSRTHLLSPFTFLRRPDIWFEVMSRVGATHTAAPNFAFEFAVRKTTPHQRARWDLSALRVVMSAAEPVKRSTMRSFYQAFEGTGLRPETFYPAYGLAEHTVSVAMGGTRTVLLDKAELELGRVMALEPESDRPGVEYVGCGRITKPDARVRIVDPGTRRPVEPGRIGEIWASSATKAPSYFGLAAETAEYLRARVAGEDDPAEYLRTGDLGFFHENELFVTGRLADLMNLDGRGIYPEGIEDSVRVSHPLIRPGGVAAFSVAVDGDQRLVVFAETTGKRVKPTVVKEIEQAVRERVRADHQLDCHAVVVGRAGLVKKTTSGKVRRRACAQAFLARAQRR